MGCTEENLGLFAFDDTMAPLISYTGFLHPHQNGGSQNQEPLRKVGTDAGLSRFVGCDDCIAKKASFTEGLRVVSPA